MLSQNLKTVPYLAVTTFLHSSLTSVTSIFYIILCVLGLVFRRLCEYVDLDNERGSEYFSNVFYRAYLLDRKCSNSITPDELGVTSPDTVLIFLIFILLISICTLIASLTLTSVILQEEMAQKYLNASVITHIGFCLVSLVIDLVIGVMFGIDYGRLSEKLNRSSGGLSMNYFNDTLRLGAMLLMSVSLKGYVYHVVNIVLIIIICIQLSEYNKHNEHSIHKLGALNGYDTQRQRNTLYPQPEMFLGRGQQLNPAFVADDDIPASPVRSTARDYQDPPASDYSNRFFDRSESWQGRSMNSGSRPFSYLGNSARPTGPPIPAPDYSPMAAKRLKSVLKPAYM